MRCARWGRLSGRHKRAATHGETLRSYARQSGDVLGWLKSFCLVQSVTVPGSDDNKKQRHGPGEARIQIKTARGNAFVAVSAAKLSNGGDEEIADRDGQQPEAHNRAF